MTGANRVEAPLALDDPVEEITRVTERKALLNRRVYLETASAPVKVTAALIRAAALLKASPMEAADHFVTRGGDLAAATWWKVNTARLRDDAREALPIVATD